MRFIVTGSQGFIGGHLVTSLLEQGHTVIGIDNLTYAANPERNIIHSNFSLVRADVSEFDQALVGQIGHVDALFHLAAESHVDNSIEGSDALFVKTNVMGTLGMLHLARKLQCRFIYMSTDEVTGDVVAGRSTEASPIRPSSPYSASKAAGELLALAYHRTFGLDVVVVRPANCYGPFQHPEKLIPRAITYILSDKPIPIYGNGTQKRDWLHVYDCVRGIIAAGQKGKSGNVYCLSAMDLQKNIDVAEIICKRLKVDAAVEGGIQYVPDRPGHDICYAQNPIKANLMLGWTAKVTFIQGLQDTISWYVENSAWWKIMINRGGRW